MKPCDWDARPKFEALIGPLRDRARELGYALAVHGSLKRDIDLIACPWTEDAVSARELADALLAVTEAVHGLAIRSWYATREPEFTLEGAPGAKPHGRLGWVIGLTHGAGPYIDLAVMPRGAPATAFTGAPHRGIEPAELPSKEIDAS